MMGKEPRWFPRAAAAAAEEIASAWRRSFSPGCNFLILFRRGRLKRFAVVTSISRRITLSVFLAEKTLRLNDCDFVETLGLT